MSNAGGICITPDGSAQVIAAGYRLTNYKNMLDGLSWRASLLGADHGGYATKEFLQVHPSDEDAIHVIRGWCSAVCKTMFSFPPSQFLPHPLLLLFRYVINLYRKLPRSFTFIVICMGWMMWDLVYFIYMKWNQGCLIPDDLMQCYRGLMRIQAKNLVIFHLSNLLCHAPCFSNCSFFSLHPWINIATSFQLR